MDKFPKSLFEYEVNVALEIYRSTGRTSALTTLSKIVGYDKVKKAVGFDFILTESISEPTHAVVDDADEQ